MFPLFVGVQGIRGSKLNNMETFNWLRGRVRDRWQEWNFVLPGNYADADTSLHSIVYDCNRMKKLNFVRLKNGRKAVCVTAT